MKTTTIEYTLPAYWASYLINNDASGLEDNEQEQIDAWVASQAKRHNARMFYCVGCQDEGYSRWNDATPLGGDVADFTFLID
jgi:hypothetical protein